MKRKILGILMSVLMVITMIPSFTFAVDLPFTDVAKDAWYYNDVKGAYDTGLINGMTDTTFEPESNMTYAQAVKLAACMNQKYSTGSVSLANGSPNWWDSYAAYAKEKEIINKDYDWNSNATRAGYVEIFAKALPDEALKEKNSIANGYIPDVGISHPQASSIYKLYRAGILTGMDDQGTFEPNSNIKRSEVSAILTRMMNETSRKELTLGPVTKKVIFNSNGGSAVETQQVAQYEKAVKPANPTREGYGFVGWYSDDELTTAFDFDLLIAEDQILYAKWEKTISSVKVVFNSNGGSAVETQQLAIYEKATKPADPTREGYKFAGWYMDSELNTVYDFDLLVSSDLTLYAKWEEATTPVTEYTVTFNTNGGSAVAEQKIKANEKVTKPADPTREGYSFVGWYKDSELTTAYDFTAAVTGDLTLFGKWIEKGATGTIKDSWEDIITSVNDGTYKGKYKIGDTKSLDLGSEGVVEMQIAAFDADELADGSGKKAAITWISNQLLKSSHRMNPDLKNDPADDSKYKMETGSIGGWEHSEMRSWLQSDMQLLIPETVRNAIKPVVKYSNICDTSGNSIKDSISKDDLWIPSYREVFGSENSETKGPVYKDLFQSDNERIRKRSGTSDVAWWWLRSDNNSEFYRVNDYGNSNTSPAGSFLGVVLGFCL